LCLSAMFIDEFGFKREVIIFGTGDGSMKSV
jgi:hypothetical protein